MMGDNNMNFGLWQIIYVGIFAMSLGTCLAKNGQPMTSKYNFITALITTTIQMTILALGGFFSN